MSGFLTEEQVADLPDGTEVEITWSGGNGPHRYVIQQDERGTWATIPDRPRLDRYNRITFVGGESFHTRVRRIIAPATEEAE